MLPCSSYRFLLKAFGDLRQHIKYDGFVVTLLLTVISSEQEMKCSVCYLFSVELNVFPEMQQSTSKPQHAMP